MIAPLSFKDTGLPLIGSIPDYTQALSASLHSKARVFATGAGLHSKARSFAAYRVPPYLETVDGPDVTIRTYGVGDAYTDVMPTDWQGNYPQYDSSGANPDIDFNALTTVEPPPSQYVSWDPSQDTTLENKATASGGKVSSTDIAQAAKDNLGTGVWDAFVSFGTGVIKNLETTAAGAAYGAAGWKPTGQSVIAKSGGKLGTLMTGPDKRIYVLLEGSTTPILYTASDYTSPPASNVGLIAGMGVNPATTGQSMNSTLAIVGAALAVLFLMR